MTNQQIGLLLLSGDVLIQQHTNAHRSFTVSLAGFMETGCRHAVDIGDGTTPTFLDAPKNLLGALNIYVVGAATRILNEIFV